jgi:hypothetical protein
MAKSATLNARAFKKDLKKLERYIYGRFAREVLDDFKKATPYDSGNARRKTAKKVKKGKSIEILTNYPYGEVLDEGLYPNPPKKGTGKTSGGYSTQAPKGMSEPTIKKAIQRFTKFVRNL